MNTKILIADDEREIREILTRIQEVVELADESVDLYILDVNMPGLSGFAAAAEIRKKYYAPILFLTAYSGEADKVMGFSVGGDDYLVKPFSNTELLLRVRAHLRRAKEYGASPVGGAEPKRETGRIVYKDLVLDLEHQSVEKEGEVIALTYTEFRILELFLTHRKKIFSMENIYQSVWEDEAVGDSTIMVHIKNLRKKLSDNSRSPEYIKTAWGKGYYVD